MSISKLQDALNSKGCQFGLVVIALLVFIGLFATSAPQCLGAGQSQDKNMEGLVVAQVGGQGVQFEEVRRMFEAYNAQQPTTNPQVLYQNLAGSLQMAVNQRVFRDLATKRGVALTDDVILTALMKQYDADMVNQKESMIMNKQLPAGATQEQFDAEVKKMTNGKGLAELRKEREDALRKQLADPAQREALVGQQIVQSLLESYAKDVTGGEQEARSSYDTFMLRRMSFADVNLPLEERKKKADEAYAELQKGTDWDAVATRFGAETPKEQVPVDRRTMIGNPLWTEVLKLTPGKMTPVLETMGSPTIYKLVIVDPRVPPDFNQRKDFYITQYKELIAGQKLIADVRASYDRLVKWSSKGYQALFSVAQAMQNQETIAQADGGQGLFRKLTDEAVAAADPTDPGYEAAVFARYAAFDRWWQSLNPAEQAEARPERAEVLTDVLQFTEDIQTLLDLYNIYLAMNEAEQAGSTLLRAAQANTDYGPQGQAIHGEISSQLLSADQQKKIPADQVKQIQEELRRWSDDKIAYDKDQAEIKREQEAEQKRLEEETRRQEAEDKAKAATPAPPTTPGGSTSGGTKTGP